MSFGETVTNLRKGKGITQEQLAEELGVTRQTISKWELDQSTPDLNYICKISELFEVTTDYLIKGGSEEPQPQKIQATCRQVQPEQKAISGTLTARSLAGVIVAILGLVLALVGILMPPEDSDPVLMMILGAIIFVMGIELVKIKKHPVLAMVWTLWGIVFAYLSGYITASPVSFVFNTMGGMILLIHLIFLVTLVIITIMIRRTE